MEAQRSSYHEARCQRDPEGFWGEAAQQIDWIEPAKQVSACIARSARFPSG